MYPRGTVQNRVPQRGSATKMAVQSTLPKKGSATNGQCHKWAVPQMGSATNGQCRAQCTSGQCTVPKKG